jgi:RNA polymerase sigma-70 factor (ECF subfamily)
MYTAAGDIALFERLRKDDRLALNTLFANYYKKLCVFADTYLRNREESEEVVSDVFVTLWRQRHQLVVESNLRAYLYIYVRHGCFAVLRKRRPEFEDVDDEAVAGELTHTVDPERILHFKELKAHLDEAVLQLPLRCRQIFMMSRYDGLRYKEISEILSISEKTVENQLIKALSIVRTHLARYQDNSHLETQGIR